jgi:toxin-antitoxin system PIN domain toxin
VILVDANLLLYAHSASAPQREASQRWIAGELAKRTEIGLAWVTITAFLRIATNPALYASPMTMLEAILVMDSYLSRSHVFKIDPTVNHWKYLQALCKASQITSRLVTDAHLAALAIEHGAALCTTDRDFRRFDGLKLIDPLAV